MPPKPRTLGRREPPTSSTLRPHKLRKISSPPGPVSDRARQVSNSRSNKSDWPPKAPLLLTEDQSENLGKYIEEHVKILQEQGFDSLVHQVRGKSDIHPDVHRLPHKAGRLLKHFQKRGAPIVFETKPWSQERVEAALKRGPHKSANAYMEFLREELIDFVRKGFWLLLPYKEIRRFKKLLRWLRISPMGVVPQRGRRPCIIVDYSFFGVNDETLKLSPREAMQFGRALERILRLIVEQIPSSAPSS